MAGSATIERNRAARVTGAESPLTTAKAIPSKREGSAARIAGVLMTTSGVVAVMGWITAEALYPGAYSTHADTLSHLGATEPPNSVVVQPSGAIFDVSMLLVGVMILVSALFLYRATRSRLVTIATGLLGGGVLGVGIFPLTSPTQHTVFALIAFVSGGAAVALSYRVTSSPFRYIWLAMGLVSLTAIALAFLAIGWQPVAALGEGGIERWNAYPIVLWLVAFGGYLMSSTGHRDDLVRGV